MKDKEEACCHFCGKSSVLVGYLVKFSDDSGLWKCSDVDLCLGRMAKR